MNYDTDASVHVRYEGRPFGEVEVSEHVETLPRPERYEEWIIYIAKFSIK